MTPRDLVKLVREAAASKKARDVAVVDLRARTTMADYFVICEGDTDRQTRAIADAVREAAAAKRIKPYHVSGEADGAWILLDYSSVIVHIFLPGERAFYDLEALWRSPRMDEVRRRRAPGEGTGRRSA